MSYPYFPSQFLKKHFTTNGTLSAGVITFTASPNSNPSSCAGGTVEILDGAFEGTYNISGTPTDTSITLTSAIGASTPISFTMFNLHKLTLPARPISYGVKLNSLIFAGDSGHEQRRPKGTPKQTFDLTYPVLSLPEYLEIKNFFLKQMNVYPFYWVDPVEKVKYLVRFDMDTFTAQNKYHGPAGPHYELTLKLLQVWS